MNFHVSREQRWTFEEDGVVKLPSVVDSQLLDELNGCFEWVAAEFAADPTSWDVVSFDVEPGDVVRPGMYDNSPIKAAAGGYLADGDRYRPAGVLNVNTEGRRA